MRLIDRLNIYREYHAITAAVFEKTCGVANGYFSNQLKGKGSVGSNILEKISQHYPDLSMEWLITGKGKMIKPISKDSEQQTDNEIKEDAAVYVIRNKLIDVLREQLELLESSVPGKPAFRKKRKKSAR